MVSKREGGAWGPTRECCMNLEHIVVGRKKYTMTNVADLKNVSRAVFDGNVVVMFKSTRKAFEIYCPQQNLRAMDKQYLVSLHRNFIQKEATIPKEVESHMEVQQYEYFDSINRLRVREFDFLFKLDEKDIATLITAESEKNVDFLKNIIKLKYPFTQDKYDKWMKKKKEKENVAS